MFKKLKDHMLDKAKYLYVVTPGWERPSPGRPQKGMTVFKREGHENSSEAAAMVR